MDTEEDENIPTIIYNKADVYFTEFTPGEVYEGFIEKYVLENADKTIWN